MSGVQVIKRIRNKDPTIYKPDVAFFEGDDEEEGAKKGKKKDKGEGRKTFKDVVREQVVAAESGRDVVASSDEEGDDEPRGRCVSVQWSTRRITSFLTTALGVWTG